MKTTNAPFRDQRIWIIGASDGIGRALVDYFNRCHARLVLSARNHESLLALANSCHQPAEVVPLDVCALAQFKQHFLSVTKNQTDRIIYLPAQYEPAQFGSMSVESIAQCIETNLTPVIHLLNWAPSYFKQYPRGQLAITASIAGIIGLPNAQPYAATKAAVISCVESYQAENPGHHIKLINPGFVKTRLTDKNQFSMPGLLSAEQAAIYIARGLASQAFEIHFPKRLSLAIKLLRCLPHSWYFKACARKRSL